jgi:hypothetical protein
VVVLLGDVVVLVSRTVDVVLPEAVVDVSGSSGEHAKPTVEIAIIRINPRVLMDPPR